jgi:hypothetical protein
VTYLPITGTFLDEITVDIPSQNWGPHEWATEFGTLAASGIDTVILIRAGCGERLACPSAAISQRVPTLPVYADLVRLFLDLAAEHGITFYLGLYDSNVFWYRYDWQTELELNLAFIDEVCDRYAGSPAFGGWYLPHETTDSSLRILDLNTALARRVKSVTPGLRSRPREPDEHARIWDEIFGHYAGLVDYCAFQDGTADPLRVAEYYAASTEVAARHGIRSWANVETFDRDMPIRFPPADWRKLAHRLDAVQPHVEKIISFELPHFMSPNSTWPSARHLYARYQEHVAGRQQ